MKIKSLIVKIGAIAALTGTLLCTACPNPSNRNEVKEKPNGTSYTVTFSAGEGSGKVPEKQELAAGAVIALPGQGEMIAPEKTTFDGWVADDYAYQAEADFTVTKNTDFVAQWRSIIDPNKTYIEFENLEAFPATMYSDSSRQVEIAQVPAKGKKLIETQPHPGTAFYPRFLLEFEGIRLNYDGAAIVVRVDEKQVNKASIPKLNAVETRSAFIKIENKSSYSLTFNKGNNELTPLGASSNIIMSSESAAYRIDPGEVKQSQYKFMKNGNEPFDFPSHLLQFEAEMLYIFTYNGNTISLSSTQPVLQALSMLPMPMSVNVSVVSASSISLSWAAVENATSYKVYRSSALNGNYEFLATLNASPYTGENLSGGTSYYYKVQAVNSERESPLSGAAAVLILPAVQGLAAQVQNAAHIRLSWQAAAGASAYKVYRSSAPDAEYELLDTVSSLAYTDESPSVGTEYFYKVQAVDAERAGQSPFAELSARILAAPQLNVLVESATSIALSCEAVEGAETYKFYRSSSPDTGFSLIATVSEPTYTDEGLSAGSLYYYKLQGANAQGDGVLSASAAVKILTAVPQNVQAQVSTSDLSISLTWAASTGASSYRVYRSTASGTGFAVVDTTNSPSYTDRNLSGGTAYYYYRIQGVNTTESGASPLSAEVSVSTPLPYYRVGTKDEMTAAIEGINSEDYPAFTIALTDSFSLGTSTSITLKRSSSTVVTMKSESAGEKTLSLVFLEIVKGISLVLESQVTLEGLRGMPLVMIESGCSFTMEAGSKVHGSTGGGVYVGNNGTFTMNGGEISGNTAFSGSSSTITISSGGGVYVNGTFTMNSGKISGNTAPSYGGGVYVAGGTFSMNGGEISGNSVSYTSASTSTTTGGGGVYVKSGTFTMSGGEISENSATASSSIFSHGGGVYVAGGTFTISGGAISGNSTTSKSSSSYATSYGGGVHVAGGTFTMSGGEISGNTASSGSRSGGGGVYVAGGTFTMSGGEISGNSATASSYSYGGGVCVLGENNRGIFTKQSGGVVYGSDGGSLRNSATTSGQAVLVSNGFNTSYLRDSTAGIGVLLDSSKSGSAGGWE